MTLQQLSYFCTLAEVLHYTRASEQLHVTQPSLSYAIAKLEDDVGVPLFLKTGKKLQLTKYGEAFLPYARQALETLDFGARKIEALRSPSRETINLGYIYSVSFDFFPTMVNEFMSLEGNRKVSFQFTQGVKADLLAKLAAGQIDLAISGAYDAPNVQKAHLLSQEIFIIMPKSNPLSDKHEISLRDLRNEALIFPDHNSGLREVLEKAFAEAGIIPHITFEAEECNAMSAFVKTGVGIAFVPKVPIFDESVAIRRLTNPPLRREIALLWMRRRVLSPFAERFKNFVLQRKWHDFAESTD